MWPVEKNSKRLASCVCACALFVCVCVAGKKVYVGIRELEDVFILEEMT